MAIARWIPKRGSSAGIPGIVPAAIWYGPAVPEPPARPRRPPSASPVEGAGLRKLTPTEKVVRSFFHDGRLVSIPAKPSKRELLLGVILDESFPEDRDYEEKEVNMRLALLHPDVAALRRYLVDGRFMTRAGGIYRRAWPVGSGEGET